MDHFSLLTFFLTGLGLGLVHAFDPDHIAAVSTMTSSRGKTQTDRPSRVAVVWSLGHGGVMLCIALMVFGFGLAIPAESSQLAEKMVPLLLIALGLLGFWRILHSVSGDKNKIQFEKNGAFFVGTIHGLAGAAPLLTIIPTSQGDHPALAIIYVVLFGFGVFLAMMGVGNIVRFSLDYARREAARQENYLHALISGFSFFLGLYLLH